MSDEVHELTPAGRIKKPAYSKVAQWVKVAWESINVIKIKNSFKCCGISVEKDGIEDDYIFDYDLLKDNIENEPVKEEILIDENMYSDDIENYENP